MCRRWMIICQKAELVPKGVVTKLLRVSYHKELALQTTIITCSFCKEIALVHCRKARQLLLRVSGRKGLAQKLGTFDVAISDCIITRFC